MYHKYIAKQWEKHYILTNNKLKILTTYECVMQTCIPRTIYVALSQHAVVGLIIQPHTVRATSSEPTPPHLPTSSIPACLRPGPGRVPLFSVSVDMPSAGYLLLWWPFKKRSIRWVAYWLTSISSPVLWFRHAHPHLWLAMSVSSHLRLHLSTHNAVP